MLSRESINPETSIQVEEGSKVKIIKKMGSQIHERIYQYEVLADRFRQLTDSIALPDPKKYGLDLVIITDGQNQVTVTKKGHSNASISKFIYDNSRDIFIFMDRESMSVKTTIQIDQQNLMIELIKDWGFKKTHTKFGYDAENDRFYPIDDNSQIQTNNLIDVNIQKIKYFGNPNSILVSEADSNKVNALYFVYDSESNSFKLKRTGLLAPQTTIQIDQQNLMIELIKDWGFKKTHTKFGYDAENDRFYPIDDNSQIQTNNLIDVNIVQSNYHEIRNGVKVTKSYIDNDQILIFSYDYLSDNFKVEDRWNKTFPPGCRDAEILNKIGNFKESLRCHQNLIIANPDNTAYKVNAIVALIGLEEFEKAKNKIEKTLDKTPENPAILNSKAMLMFKVGKFTEAKEIYQKIISKHPKYADVHIGLANVYRLTGNIVSATYHYGLADIYSLDHKQQNAFAKNGFSLMHQTIFDNEKQIGNLDTAIFFNNQAIELDGQNVDGYNGKGNALVKKGMVLGHKALCDDAKKAFQKTLDIFAENLDATRGMQLISECEATTKSNTN